MQIGFTLPQIGPLARQAGEVARFATEAERLGAASLWVGDRLLAPVTPTVGYGGSDRIPETFHTVLDPFAVLAVAATATSTAVIGTNVLNAPWYAPAILGRSLTTIDRLSNGRLVAGLGVGWSPEEYVAAGIPMNERGARLDEILDALTAWWTTDPVAHEGRYWHIPESHVQLKPISSPQPPIYLGGYSAAAMRRAARRADGWLPVLVPGRMEFDAQAVTGPMTAIRAMAAEAGRDPAELGSILRVYPQGDAGVGEVLEFLDRAGREAGVSHAFVELMNIVDDVDEALEVVGHVLSRLG